MTSLSVVSIISQWPIWIVFHLLRWNILSKQKEEKPLISLYASATQRPRTSLEALLQSWNLNHLSWNEKALGGRSFKLYELKFIEYLEKKWKIACEQHEFHWQSFDRTLIRWISCNNSRSKVLKPVVFDAQTIARSSCDSVKTPMEFDRCSHAIFHFFSKYLKTFNHKIKKIQAGGRYWFSGYVAVDRKL